MTLTTERDSFRATAQALTDDLARLEEEVERLRKSEGRAEQLSRIEQLKTSETIMQKVQAGIGGHEAAVEAYRAKTVGTERCSSKGEGVER